MREYSPKRRTALVLTGSGASGAYHAGVLKALDESGVKIDLVVGSGVGTLGAAFAAVAGGARLYGPEGFWRGLGWGSLYRLRGAFAVARGLLALALVVCALPLLAALLAGIAFPLLLVADAVAPGSGSGLLATLVAAPSELRGPYLFALATPAFVFCVMVAILVARGLLRHRRRKAEPFETLFDAERARTRLAKGLWEVSRGIALAGKAPAEAEIGRRYIALALENLGQPGFRELILRTGDLETGRVLPFVLLQDLHRAAFAEARSRGARSRLEGLPGAIDLRAPENAALLFDVLLTGLLPPFVAPPRRVTFPRGGLHAGETHRLADASLVGGSGLGEALEAGAEQVILVAGSAAEPGMPARRRGPWALLDASIAALERRALEADLEHAARSNRLIEVLGHETPEGGRAFEDPETGRRQRAFALYPIRPASRTIGPLELDGAMDPATEVELGLADLAEQGYRDAYRLFVEPVLGGGPEPRPDAADEHREHAIGL
jgi:hypothetical protein